MKTVLEVRDLEVQVKHKNRFKKLVEQVNFSVKKGQCLGILGESGSGKSMTTKAILGLLNPSFQIRGQVIFKGQDLLGMPSKNLRQIRGKEIGVILQNPMTCFDPLYKIREQMYETFRTHHPQSSDQLLETCLSLLETMKINDPKEVLNKYPHQLSGGMLQRIMIGMAIGLKPDLIIADEPTTAIDAITQFELMKTFNTIKEQTETAMIFISHDLGVISKISDDVMVMKAGSVVERGSFKHILHHSSDPYTRNLVDKKVAMTQAYCEMINRKRNLAG